MLTCALCGGAFLERAADPLHSRWIDATLDGNGTDAATGCQSGTDSFFYLWGYPGPSKLFPPATGWRTAAAALRPS